MLVSSIFLRSNYKYLPILHLYVFFFYCYGDHRDLHSFPTRRSSDLPRRRHPHRRCPTARCSTVVASSSASRGRSEEHTSELQSRPHLVCRLLLEKKKN